MKEIRSREITPLIVLSALKRGVCPRPSVLCSGQEKIYVKVKIKRRMYDFHDFKFFLGWGCASLLTSGKAKLN